MYAKIIYETIYKFNNDWLFSFEKNLIFKEKYMYVVKQNQHGKTNDKSIITTIKSYNIYFTLSSVQTYDKIHLSPIILFK